MFFLCLSRMLCCLTACYLAALQKPRTGTTTVHWGRASALDSILTANTEQPPYKPTGGESSTAEQPVHWESVVENWATGLRSPLWLPLHVSLSFHFLSLDPNTDWNVVLATSGGPFQSFCCLSLSCYHSYQCCLFTSAILQKLCGLHINLGKCSRFSILMSMDDGMTGSVVNVKVDETDLLLQWPNVELCLRLTAQCVGFVTRWLWPEEVGCDRKGESWWGKWIISTSS